eukprot:SAG22_NODE_5793_length_951_cov_1.497653_1_plen_36_part_10
MHAAAVDRELQKSRKDKFLVQTAFVDKSVKPDGAES